MVVVSVGSGVVCITRVTMVVWVLLVIIMANMLHMYGLAVQDLVVTNQIK